MTSRNILASQLATKAVEACEHTLVDDGDDWYTGESLGWYTGESLGAACERCVKKLVLEVMALTEDMHIPEVTK